MTPRRADLAGPGLLLFAAAKTGGAAPNSSTKPRGKLRATFAIESFKPSLASLTGRQWSSPRKSQSPKGKDRKIKDRKMKSEKWRQKNVPQLFFCLHFSDFIFLSLIFLSFPFRTSDLVGLPHQPQSLQREQWIDGGNLRQFRGNQLAVAASGHDRQPPHAQLALQFEQQLSNQSPIAVDRADQHRLLGALANRAVYLPDFDPRQEGGFLVQIIRHRRQARSDDTAGVIARAVHHVESHRRPEINDYHGRAESVPCRQSVGQAIGANAGRLWIIDANASQSFWGQFQTMQAPVAADGLRHQRRGLWHHTAQSHTLDARAPDKSQHPPSRLVVSPIQRGNISLPDHAHRIGQAEVRVRIADVQQQGHSIHLSTSTSPPTIRSSRRFIVGSAISRTQDQPAF